MDVTFEGIVIPDHVPGLESDPAAGAGRGGGGAGRGPGAGFRPNPALAYLLGCMNSMLLAAQGKRG